MTSFPTRQPIYKDHVPHTWKSDDIFNIIVPIDYNGTIFAIYSDDINSEPPKRLRRDMKTSEGKITIQKAV